MISVRDIVSQPFSPGRLTSGAVLRAYREGFFPMACGDGRMRWFSPDPRGVIPLAGFHLPHGFRRALPGLGFGVTVDTAFADVVAGCADRPETWIDPSIARTYSDLCEQGYAHSVEVWAGHDLVGGLYGVRIGGAFFGESMFSRVSEASKVALLVLVCILRERAFRLLDIQWVTAHLELFGAEEVRRARYLQLLAAALPESPGFPRPGPVDLGALLLRASTLPRRRRKA